MTVQKEAETVKLDPGGKMKIDPLATPYRAVFEDLDYGILRSMFNEYWEVNQNSIISTYKVKGKKSKGGKQNSAQAMMENTIGIKKLYGSVIVNWAVDKIKDVLHIEGFDIYGFEEGNKPIIAIMFYYVPKIDMPEINFEMKKPFEEVDEDKEWNGYCDHLKLQNRILADYEGDDINSNSNVLVDVIATMDNKPYDDETMRMQWLDVSRYHNKMLVEDILKHKKGDLFESEWLRGGLVVKAQVKIHALQTISYPEINDELAKDMNFDSLMEMKHDFISKLRERSKNIKERYVVDNIVNEIVSKSSIPHIPDKWIDIRADMIMRDHIKNNNNNIKKSMMSVGARTEDQMKDKFKSVILQEIVKKIAINAYIIKYNVKEEEKEIIDHMIGQVKWM